MKVTGFQDTINWYDRNAEGYAKSLNQLGNTEQINQFVKLLPKGAKVLDAGSAGGRDTNLLSLKGLDVIGLDISKGLLSIARKNYPHLKFIEGNFLSLPFKNDSFDGVWSHASLVHLETIDDVRKALSEFFRVLKLNGVLHVLVKAQIGNNKTQVISDSIIKHNRFFQYFKEDEIKKLIQDTGFNIIYFEHYREIDKNPKGRKDTQWYLTLAKKKE